MKHRKAVTLINIAGLVLGITGAVLIFEYVFYERSYDSFHRNSDNLFRLSRDRYRENTLMYQTAYGFFPTGGWVKSNYAEVEDYFMMSQNYNIEISVKENASKVENFFEEKAYYASTSIFDNLDFILLHGTDSCLKDPYTVAISERMAEKLFERRNAMGEVITINGQENFTVTGVYKNIPSNSHIKTDMFFSMSTVLSTRDFLRNDWINGLFYVYFRLRPGTDYKELERKIFPRMLQENYAQKLAPNSERDEYRLQPIKSIHLFSALEYEPEPPGNGKSVNILFVFSLFLLILAWINYINLVTARSVERAKEVGVKKVCGGTRKTLIGQFISEALFFNLLCIVLSIMLIFLLMPFFKQLTGIEQIGSIIGTKFLLYTFLFLLTGVAFSGIYPALVLSSFKPFDVLKGNFKNSKRGIFLRKGLITFQLFVSITMFIGAGIIYGQVKFLFEKDLGYSHDSVLVIKTPRTDDKRADYRSKIEVLADKLRSNPDIKDFTLLSDIPGQEIKNVISFYKKGEESNQWSAYFRTDIDPAFMDFFRIKLLAGRNFTEEDKSSPNKFIVNVKAAQRMGCNSPEEAVGKIVINFNREHEIIGVTEDVNYASVKVEAVPTIFTLRDFAIQYMTVKYSATINTRYVIDDIRREYKSVFPDSAFDYEILEDKIIGGMKSDRTFSTVFGIFSVLAGMISIIGILGLVIIIINQNIKGLGVRRVLGAGLHDVNAYLWKHFYPQLIVAVCLAVPVSYYIFQKQVLENYVYRISLSPGYLILPVILIAAVLAFVVVVFARKAFSENLTRILKSE